MKEPLEVLLEYIKGRMERTAEVLNKESVITDSGRDITEFLRGRLDAYANMKFFIDNGMRDV